MDGQIAELNAHNIFLVLLSHRLSYDYDTTMAEPLIKSGGRLQGLVRRYFQTKVHAQRTKFLRQRPIPRVGHHYSRSVIDRVKLIPGSDSTASPEGKDGIVVLIPVGHLLPTPEGDTVKMPNGETQDWPTLVNKARDQVIYTMETRLGIKGLKDKILWEEVNTPLTCTSTSGDNNLFSHRVSDTV